MKKNSLLKILVLSILSISIFSCSKKTQELRIYSIIHDEETRALTELFTKKREFQFLI